MSAQGAEFVRSGGKKGYLSGKRPQKMEPSDRPNLCHHLLGVGGGLEAEHTRFLASARRKCHSGLRFVQQGADHRQFLQGYGNANMEKSGWAFAHFGHGERYPHRLCQEGQSQLKFHKLHVRWTFLFVEPSTDPPCPRMDRFPTKFSVFVADQRTLATRKHELWECPWAQTDQSHTHMKESDHFVTLAQEFWDTDQVLFARGLLPRDWLPASELAECSKVRMWESSGFKECRWQCLGRL